MKFLKGAMVFILGAGVGSGVTYVILKDKFDRKLNEELSELREHYKNKEKKAKDVETTEGIINVEGYISKEEVLERVRAISENALSDSRPKEDYPDEPFEITEEDFSERELSFEKVEADYYMDDSALVDDTEEMINIEDCVGYKNIQRFREDNNKDIMYIRNPNLGTDYLVTKLSGSYSEIIGVGGDDDD